MNDTQENEGDALDFTRLLQLEKSVARLRTQFLITLSIATAVVIVVIVYFILTHGDVRAETITIGDTSDNYVKITRHGLRIHGDHKTFADLGAKELVLYDFSGTGAPTKLSHGRLVLEHEEGSSNL